MGAAAIMGMIAATSGAGARVEMGLAGGATTIISLAGARAFTAVAGSATVTRETCDSFLEVAANKEEEGGERSKKMLKRWVHDRISA